MVTEKAAPKQGPEFDLAVRDVTALAAYFESYIESVTLPVINSIYPYETISNPFDSALFGYLAADIKDFEEKLASLTIINNQPFDFVNASIDELLDTPVDSAAENTTKVSHDNDSGEVNSQERDLSTSDTFGATSSGVNNPFVISKSPFQQISSDSTSLGGGLTLNSTNYIANISQGPFQVSSQETSPLFRMSMALDAVSFASLVGKAKNLLDGTFIQRGDSITLDGISPNINGPFLLKDILDKNSLRILLGQAEIVSVDKNGGFTFVANNKTPIAETFYFRVNELDKVGNVIEQKVGKAHISEIQDQSFTMVLNDSKFTADGNVTLTSNTGLLAHSAAAGDAVLSIISINPTLNSVDPTADNFELLTATNAFQVFNHFNFAETSLSLSSNGAFSFSTTSSMPLTLSYIVSDGLGQTALASATFIPKVMPIVLDLTGEGISLVSPEHSPITLGSLTGTNNPTSVGWIGDGNGILMYDPNGTNELTSLNQISFVSYLHGAQTDLAGLSAFDSNHNSYFDSGDDRFNLFDVLFADGTVESLSQLGIVSISLNSDKQIEHTNGNTVFGQTTYQTTDGQSHIAADVGLGVGHSSKITIQPVSNTQEMTQITEQIAQNVVEPHF